MPIELSRRALIGAAASATVGATGKASQPKKSVMFSMLPGNLSLQEKFKLAHDVGFEGVEVPPVPDNSACMEMRKAADAAGVRIHSVIYGGWDAPLTSPDPAVVERGIEATTGALQSAKWLGADDILLVPALVTAETRYVQAYQRSQKQVRRLIPTAEKLGVMILIEEVWNKFLLSPLEYVRFIDEFRHPLVQSYFDVGNVVINGWPEDWIRTIGHRIKKVHLKDFRRASYQFVNLLEGDIDWKEVRKAFTEVGFTGYMNTELPGGDAAYLRDVSRRVDRILAD